MLLLTWMTSNVFHILCSRAFAMSTIAPHQHRIHWFRVAFVDCWNRYKILLISNKVIVITIFLQNFKYYVVCFSQVSKCSVIIMLVYVTNEFVYYLCNCLVQFCCYVYIMLLSFRFIVCILFTLPHQAIICICAIFLWYFSCTSYYNNIKGIPYIKVKFKRKLSIFKIFKIPKIVYEMLEICGNYRQMFLVNIV